MAQTLLIYDNDGKIFLSISGSYETPNGLQHLEVDVPSNSYVDSVNVSVEPHEAVIKLIPKTKLEELEEMIEEHEVAMIELANMFIGSDE
jgi:hypothetical protein